jgi:hypothetical protein
MSEGPSAITGTARTSEGEEERIAAIRAHVHREGGYTLARGEFELLCPDHITASETFGCVARIAQKEHWSFAFLPDGKIHFGAYRA